MSVCPFEWRYGSDEMRKIWSLQNRLKVMVEIERALLKALVEAGLIPRVNYEELRKVEVNPREVLELERELKHDVMAFTEALRSKLDPETGKYVHLGATSYDIVDTAWALQIRDALALIYDKLKRVIEKLSCMAIEYKDLVSLGRTHGQWALPITIGFKFANYVYELTRSYERLRETERRVVRLKMSGAVGTMAAWGGKGLLIEKIVAEELGLEPHVISTQVAPRDGFAELISNLAILSSVLDRFALEVRELSRPEISEIVEGVEKGQVGSSTMPHKANPIISEKISGLAKVARGLVVSELENVPLWHERDLTNSSSERIIIPHQFLILDEQLESMLKLLRKLIVNRDAIRRNLEKAGCVNLAERVMVYLTLRKGLARNDAHKLVMNSVREYGSLEEALKGELGKYLSESELKELCDPTTYLGNVSEIIDRTIRYAEETLGVRFNQCTDTRR
ncbi:adenylosuccinate lyase [Ignicoccus islandicus DSM 13165]|uniref:Adenylosuccinate lyase n=1 Tax=Ignicoccus islandicus DSM 13165 TaxID=940295 RepID=A0A0U3G0A4_9CREN|nr:adenylosuccinate lyase [Ignicoccus islandicus]ALU11756.1 adenylosuccinate lyase [Ignicoccus islandicus DSM 13165]